MMNIPRTLRYRLALFNQLKLNGASSYCTTTNEKIEIPKAIPRGPTDILRALESTISRDPTAAHYKYHDDPYLLPMSNMTKRTYAMAQEAGRKAAQWIRSEHSDLFQHKVADPPIEPFFPPMIYTDKSQVSVDDLNKLIATGQVSDAKLVYKLLKDQGQEVDPAIELSLLEMLCYQNCDDKVSEELIEEKWFKQSTRTKEKQRKTWKDGDFAEELFQNFDNPGPEAYSAIIQGMVKYYQVDRAWRLFEEAQQKGVVVNTNTFNGIISVANFLKEGYDIRWSFVTDLLQQMNKDRLRPNLGTLNAVLQCLSNSGSGQMTKNNAMKTLAEFKRVGIEPSLATWYYVLVIFCKERGPVSTILNDIIVQIEDKEHPIRDLKDTNFFVTAMDVCCNHLRDVDLGKRVDKLLHYKNNYDLIGDSYKEAIYFRHYFTLLCANTPFEDFMAQTYQKLVPHIYVPEPTVMAEVLNQMDSSGAIGYLPRLWSDMIIFDHHQRESLIDLVLNIMSNNHELAELTEKFASIAWDIYSKLENQKETKVNKISITGDLLGKILLLVAKNNQFERACEVMDKLDKDHQSIAGVPKIEALDLFVDLCIEQKAPSRAISCIQYCADSGFTEANVLAARLNEKLTLDETHLERLSKIVDVSLNKIE